MKSLQKFHIFVFYCASLSFVSTYGKQEEQEIPFLTYTTASSSPSGCLDGYVYGTDDSNKCYKVYSYQYNKTGALIQCENDGGKLASIGNAFTNTLISTLAQNESTQAFIGLTCYSSNETYCLWDDGSGYDVFNKFYNGYPNVNVGECVVMTSSGRWISADCYDFTAGFACEYFSPINNTQGSCDDSYTEYNGMCYKLYQSTQDDMSAFCKSNGGNLVSIHSLEENNFVISLTNTKLFRSRVVIGLIYQYDSKSYNWTDSTLLNFNNIGYENINEGSCMAMIVTDEDFIAKGQWFSVPCNIQIPFVCERSKGAVVVPQTPDQCPRGAVQFNDTGMIYSPSFPNPYPYQNDLCQYLITVNGFGLQAYIFFDEFNLDSNSSILLYNTPSDVYPFQTLKYNYGYQTGYQSSTNTMLIIFQTDGAPNDGVSYNWAAKFFGRPPGSL